MLVSFQLLVGIFVVDTKLHSLVATKVQRFAFTEYVERAGAVTASAVMAAFVMAAAVNIHAVLSSIGLACPKKVKIDCQCLAIGFWFCFHDVSIEDLSSQKILHLVGVLKLEFSFWKNAASKPP